MSDNIVSFTAARAAKSAEFKAELDGYLAGMRFPETFDIVPGYPEPLLKPEDRDYINRFFELMGLTLTADDDYDTCVDTMHNLALTALSHLAYYRNYRDTYNALRHAWVDGYEEYLMALEAGNSKEIRRLAVQLGIAGGATSSDFCKTPESQEAYRVWMEKQAAKSAKKAKPKAKKKDEPA